MSSKIRGIVKVVGSDNAFSICLRILRYRFVKYRFVRYTFRFVRYRYHQYFVCIYSAFKTSSRYVFKTCLQDMSSRRLQRNHFSSSKTSCKMSSKRLQDVLEDVKLLLHWRHVEDVFKTCLQDISLHQIFLIII